MQAPVWEIQEQLLVLIARKTVEARKQAELQAEIDALKAGR